MIPHISQGFLLCFLRLGVRTVGIYSEADKYARHVEMVDEAHFIGPPKPAQSYLLGEKILEIAQKTGSEAIHPG